MDEMHICTFPVYALLAHLCVELVLTVTAACMDETHMCTFPVYALLAHLCV
jgi:hypothetical protein